MMSQKQGSGYTKTFKLLGEDVEIVSALEDDQSCNTRKSRDKVNIQITQKYVEYVEKFFIAIVN